MTIITAGQLQAFRERLRQAERSPGTVENYLRTVRAFDAWLGGTPVGPDSARQWKGELVRVGYHPRTVNTMLAALRGFFRFVGWAGYETRSLRVQRTLFREEGRELARQEYERLLETAQAGGKTRLALVMEAICATGIRVSEVRCLTVERARKGRAEIALKGKIRTILIPGKLARKLLKYARAQKILAGEIFLTGKGKTLSRR